MRYIIIRLGHKRSLALITLSAIILSIMISIIIKIIRDIPLDADIFVIPVLTPLLIAPALSWSHIKLIIEINGLEQKMRKLATIDSLTELFNRRYFLELSQKIYALNTRHKEPFTLLMLDIDHFKKVNDTYGHLGGDAVLKALGKLINQFIRKSDLVGRFGGEEFIFLLPKSNLQGGKLVACRLKDEINDLSVQFQEHSIKFTASIGGTIYHPGDNTSLEALIQKADNALYRAKNQGRNCYIFE